VRIVTRVEENSIADELDIRPGDRLISINGQTIKDVFDYRYLQKDECLNIEIKKPDGEEWELEIEKDEDEELGLIFETGLMDEPTACRNKCIFCFIDQLPPGMRSTLYFKDDDVRLGFLRGNYVTLTNLSDAELDRIIYYRLSPVNISVHAADPALRVRMLTNPRAAGLMAQLDKLRDAGIEMNFQIVLCKGINDGERLDESIYALSEYIPQARSLSVVPVGLTKHRAGLPPLEAFTVEDADAILNQIEGWQGRLKERFSTRFVFAADEFYLLAGRALPGVKDYEDFPQIENGVGMMVLFADEFRRSLRTARSNDGAKQTVVTGMAAYPFISGLVRQAKEKYPALDIQVIAVENNFFGRRITVSGLLTGKDILNTLSGRDLGNRVLLPKNALRADEKKLLDDIDLKELNSKLSISIEAIDVTGTAFLRALNF